MVSSIEWRRSQPPLSVHHRRNCAEKKRSIHLPQAMGRKNSRTATEIDNTVAQDGACAVPGATE
jgi:hypothetical protein